MEIGFNLLTREQQEKDKSVPLEEIRITMGEHQITSGEVVVETTDGDKVYPIGKEQPQTRSRMRLYAAEADQTGEGSIVINLGGQIAVKKVTLRITGTSNQGNLAEISKVEFVNDMEKRIPDTQWDTPENLQANPGTSPLP